MRGAGRWEFPVFGVATIMRLPAYNNADEEPDYWDEYGQRLHEWSELRHRIAVEPGWGERLAAHGVFDFLALTQDDTSAFGLPALEQAELLRGAENLALAEQGPHPRQGDCRKRACFDFVAGITLGMIAGSLAIEKSKTDRPNVRSPSLPALPENDPSSPPLRLGHTQSKPFLDKTSESRKASWSLYGARKARSRRKY